MKNTDYILLCMLIVSFVIPCFLPNKLDYGKEPSNKQYNEYNQKHKVVGEIKPFHPNIKNDFKMREFVVGTSKFYGELDGYGRSPFAYSGLANNPVDQEVLKKIVREIIREELKNGKAK